MVAIFHHKNLLTSFFWYWDARFGTFWADGGHPLLSAMSFALLLFQCYLFFKASSLYSVSSLNTSLVFCVHAWVSDIWKPLLFSHSHILLKGNTVSYTDAGNLDSSDLVPLLTTCMTLVKSLYSLDFNFSTFNMISFVPSYYEFMIWVLWPLGSLLHIIPETLEIGLVNSCSFPTISLSRLAHKP